MGKQRKTLTVEQKLMIILAALREEHSVAALARQHGVSEQQIPHSPGFSGRGCHRSSKASRCENLEIEQPVACRDFSSFDFYPALPSMLGAPLIRH